MCVVRGEHDGDVAIDGAGLFGWCVWLGVSCGDGAGLFGWCVSLVVSCAVWLVCVAGGELWRWCWSVWFVSMVGGEIDDEVSMVAVVVVVAVAMAVVVSTLRGVVRRGQSAQKRDADHKQAR